MLVTLEEKLRTLVEARDYAALQDCLDGLSHSKFRAAGSLLGQHIAPQLEAGAFWPLFGALVAWQPKAFLVTMLKAFLQGMREGRLTLTDEGFSEEAVRLRVNEIDRRKVVETLLPALDEVQLIRLLFIRMGYVAMDTWIPFLLKDMRLPTAFLLLQALHYVEHDRALLHRVANHLVGLHVPLSFNMASLMCVCFDLHDVRGTFSLRLQPYQLSRLEHSYELFCSVMSMK